MQIKTMNKLEQKQGLYRPEFEHDACGVGFVAHVKGERSHQQIVDALVMLENMEQKATESPTIPLLSKRQ